jgi:hypothetical protein
LTNYDGLTVESDGDRAPKTVYTFVQLGKEGKYANVIFQRLIPDFLVGCAEYWVWVHELIALGCVVQGVMLEGYDFPSS